MLDDYKNNQEKVYKILKNSVLKDKLSHAYLFETNGNKKAYDMALSFAKYILCPYNYSNNSKCVKCTQCVKIDKNIFSELKIIEPDGLWIKKEQLEELQQEFSYQAVEANKKIYIINHADRLNQSAANSILKFLEEPEPNIIAILIVDNLYQVMETIQSRCQIINFNKEQLEDNLSTTKKIKEILNVDDLIEEEQLEEQIKNVVTFINYIEIKKLDAISASTKLFHNFFKEKKEVLLAMEIMVLYYKDLINQKLKREKEIFKNFDDNKLVQQNTLDELSNKMLIIIKEKEKINYNANISLLIDKLIMELVGEI